ncbi:MAG: hypothetical protein HYX47_02945 [Burkholderiales bacterium]|nr:hypothetical protein [Burkholderiales bacterium]
MDDYENNVRHLLRDRFERTFEEKVQRALEVRPQAIVPNTHFTTVSNECISLYRDGYFMATAMATQALNEGLIRFIADRNEIASNQDPYALVDQFEAQKIVTPEGAAAFRRVLRSFRNDFHHLNPSISKVPVRDIAKRNIEDIAGLEREFFEHEFHEGGIAPKQPKYWDLTPQGTMLVNLRSG